MTSSSFGRVASFGQRAEMERLGLAPDPEPEPEPERVEVGRPRSRSTVEITVTPVLDQEAMVAVADQITELVRAAFQRGFSEGIAEAERMLDS